MILDKIFYEKWVLAYAFQDKDFDPLSLPTRFHVLNPPRGYCWADPFVINEGGKYFILDRKSTRLNSSH